MTDELTVTCDCGWTARGPQEVLVRRIREHARDVHGLDVTPEQALAQTRPVAAHCFSHGMHSSQFGIQVAPTSIAVKRHGQSALRLLDAHDAGIAAGTLHSVGLHHGVVLLVNPALGADVLRGEESL